MPSAVINAVDKYRLGAERQRLQIENQKLEEIAKNNLNELSNKLLLATKAAGIGIWEYLFAENRFIADDVLLANYGITQAEFNGTYQELMQYVYPEDQSKISLDFKNAFVNFSDVDTEFRILWKDGSIHFIKAIVLVQRDDAGNPIRLVGTHQEITESKKAEQQHKETSLALSKALNDLTKVLDSSLDVIFSIDREGRFKKVSAASEKLWGYLPGELIGKKYIDFVYKVDTAKTNVALASIIAGVDMTNFENYQVHKNGSLVPMVLSARWDNNENIIYCIARDATEKKLADEQLLLSEQRFKDLVQGGADLIVILDPQGNYLYVSPNSIDILGIGAEEFIGKNTFSFMHPDDQEMAITSFSRIANEKKIMVPPIRFQHKDGSWRWLDSSVTNFLDNPAINGIVINARDVTVRKQEQDVLKESEARLAAAQAVAKVGSWETDLLSSRVKWSKETYRIFEVNSQTSISHQAFLELTHPDDRAKVNAAFLNSISDDRISSIEHRIITPAGLIKTVEEKWHVLRDENDKPVSVVGTVQDITERIKTEQILIRSEAKYRAFFENSLDGILLTVTDGKILSANPAACRMFRMTEEEICETGPFGLINFSDGRAEELLKIRRQTGRAKGELTCLRNDGSTFPGEISSVVFSDSFGRERTSIIVRDITERKKSEEKLVASEAKYRTLFEQNLAGFYQTNAEGQILQCNQAFAKMLKYDSVQELLAINSIEFYFSPVHRSQFIEKSLDKRDLYSQEGVMKCKDGSPLYYLENVSVQKDKETGLETFNGIILDISDRKMAEEKLLATSDALQHALKELNNIMDSSLDIICSVDGNGKFVSVSAASEQIWGFKPEEVVGKTFIDLVFEEDKQITEDVVEKIMDGLSVTMFENRYVHKDGSKVPLLWSARWDENNQMMYCIAKDAREKKRLEKTFEY